MRWHTPLLMITGTVALVGFAGAAQASATIDLIWIDVTNVDSAGEPICLRPAERNCPQIGASISSVAFSPSGNIALGVIITAGPDGSLGAGVSANYGEALPGFSVVDFQSTTTTLPLMYLPGHLGTTTNQPPFIDFINAFAAPSIGLGIGLPPGQTAYLGTVSFHKDFVINGTYEITVGTDGPGETDAILDGVGNNISSTTTFNSAFIYVLPSDNCIIDKKCSVGGSTPQDSCTADPGEEVTYTYDVIEGCGFVIDNKLGVIGEWKGQTLSRTTTLTETTTNRASIEPTECICIYAESDSVTVTVGAPTPTPTSTLTPTPTPTTTPTTTPTPSRSKKVTVCHKGKDSISVSANAVPAHLAHGDALGACP